MRHGCQSLRLTSRRSSASWSSWAFTRDYGCTYPGPTTRLLVCWRSRRRCRITVLLRFSSTSNWTTAMQKWERRASDNIVRLQKIRPLLSICKETLRQTQTPTLGGGHECYESVSVKQLTKSQTTLIHCSAHRLELAIRSCVLPPMLGVRMGSFVVGEEDTQSILFAKHHIHRGMGMWISNSLHHL